MLIGDIIKALKVSTETARLKALEQDVRAAVYGAEQIYGAGHGEEKLSHAMEYLKGKGYDPDKEMLQPFIEATVFEMQQGKKKPQRARIAYAQSAEEIREKYGRRRFTSANAGKSLLYNHIYRGYQLNEGTPPDQLQPLYNLDTIRGKVDNYDDANLYNVFVNFIPWQSSAFEAAIIVRNGLKSLIAQFYNLTASTLAAENLRRSLGDRAKEADVWIWLHSLTIDNYTPQSDNRFTVTAIREDMENALRYINSYNTLIDMIAEELEIPELCLYRLDMKTTEAGIISLNEALKALSDDVSLYRIEEAVSPEELEELRAGDVLDHIDRYTPDYIRDTLSAFTPISSDPAPIPQDNLTAARNRLHYSILTDHRNAWHDLMPLMNANYWRRSYKHGR